VSLDATQLLELLQLSNKRFLVLLCHLGAEL
jgi:hypothetical protein